MKINYLSKNILFGFVILILIIVWAFAFSTLAKHLNFWLALSLPLVVFLITTYFIKRTNNFISGFLGEHEVGDGLKGLGSDYIIIY